MKVAGCILAGGQSRRMGGGDKALRPLGGGVMLDQVIARIAPQLACLSLNANGDAARFARFGLPVLPDPAGVAGQGPLAGVLAAMIWAEGLGCAQVVTVAADTPFLPGDLVPWLLLTSEQAEDAAGVGRPVLAASGDGALHPAIALWPVALRATLDEALRAGRRKVRDFALSQGAVTRSFPGDPFYNVNTPEDLEMAEQMLRRAGQA